MRFASSRTHSRASVQPGIVAPARVDRRTKNLPKRLKPGDIAVIDHEDLDRVGAEALVAGGVSAVVNASASSTGRYPNIGPGVLLAAGIPLVDNAGPAVMEIPEGAQVRVEDGCVFLGDALVGRGTVLTEEANSRAMAEARAGLSEQLEAFAANTMDFLVRERDLLLDGVGVPEIRTGMDGRHVLVVVRGYHFREDLRTLRSYIREYRPILVGVDGGADALLHEGYLPDLIVGDMDSVSDRALTCGAEIVVHAYRDGRAPGLARVESLGLPAVVFPAAGTSEDIAMLLADDKGASLIVAVGTHATLVEFLDKGRAGMASTFLTRLRIGGKLVDAKGVSRLYRSRISTLQVVLLVLAGLVALLVALWSTATGQVIFIYVQDRWADFTFWLGKLLS